MRWLQINTDSIRLVFPSHWKGEVYPLAAMASYLGKTQATLGNQFRKFDIVLQPQTTVSNAYVGLGPRRSEFFMTPLQNSFALGSLPWSEQLMLHEFRHIQQFNNFNKGVSNVFYLLGGQLGLSLINNTAIPNWFWEGDAVYQETRESEQGRGRLPYFFNGYRSLWADKRPYKWLKLRNGSLRDYVPDHYQLGYLLTAYGREKWGDAFWGKVTDRAVRFKGLFYPFQSAVRHTTGLRYQDFVTQAFAFSAGRVASTHTDTLPAEPVSKHFSGDAMFPHLIDSSHVLYVGSSYHQVPAFIVRDLHSGEERKVRTRDFSLDNYFSYRNGKAVYAALGFDTRWGWRDYGDIRILDIETGQQHRVTRRTKYFSPDISADGSEIVAVAMFESGESRLHIISSANGERKELMPHTEGWVYTYPKFMGAQQVVAAVRNERGEMGLVRLHRESGGVDTLIPFSLHVIGFPSVYENTVCVTVSWGETDQLFMVRDTNFFMYRPASINRTTGSYQGQVRDGRIVWSQFTSSGYRIRWDKLAQGDLLPVKKDRLLTALPDFGFIALSPPSAYSSGSEKAVYTIEPYKKSTRIVNIHSWLPAGEDPAYSIGFISENVLNTLQGEAAFTYNRNEQSKQWSVNGTYAALFPWLRGGLAYTSDRSVRSANRLIRWNEWQAKGGMAVPLNFSGGRSLVHLTAASDYVFTKQAYQGAYKDSFSRTAYAYLDHQLVFTHQIQQARQHIFPRIAQTVKLQYAHAIRGLSAHQFLASGNWYFPGCFVNHHLVVQTAWQQRDTIRQLYFTNLFPFSRGYNRLHFHRMYRWAVNYHFPIAYPDWGLASIVYVLRMRANLFYDATRVQDYNLNRIQFTRSFRSAGVEVYFDTKWWNQQPVSLGFRYARLLDPAHTGLGVNQWEFIMPVNLVAR